MTSKSAQIVITGGTGFLGTQVVSELRKKKYRNLRVANSHNFDLRNRNACLKLLKNAEVVIHLASKVGGIGFNRKYPADIFYENLLISLNILQAAKESNIKKFVGVGTVCSYPKYTPIPFREEHLWDGYPEETNAAFGLAKKMLLVGLGAYRTQYNFNGIYLIPVNLYGPGDNFDPENSHVIPALIQKIYSAKKNYHKKVVVWGSGRASREFLYVEDAGHAIVLAMERYDKQDPVNIGSGEEIFINDLVKKIARLLDYQGEIVWDKTQPDGQPRRLVSSTQAFRHFGFRSQISLEEGLVRTIRWYSKQARD